LGLEVGDGEGGEGDGAVEVDAEEGAAVDEEEVKLGGALLVSGAQEGLEVVDVGEGGVDEGLGGERGGFEVSALAEVMEEEVEGGLAVGLAPDVVAEEVGEVVAEGGVGKVRGGEVGRDDVALVGEEPVAEAEGGGVLGADVAAGAAADEANDGAGAEVGGEVREGDVVREHFWALADEGAVFLEEAEAPAFAWDRAVFGEAVAGLLKGEGQEGGVVAEVAKQTAHGGVLLARRAVWGASARVWSCTSGVWL
jgi:hypothetical protein